MLRVLPMDGGNVVFSYLDEMQEVAATAVADAELASLGKTLSAGVANLRNVTQWMLDCDDPNDALAGASPYLRAFGVVAGAHYLRQGGSRRSPHQYRRFGRVPRCQGGHGPVLRASQILPQAESHYPAATAGADQLFAIDPKYLEAS